MNAETQSESSATDPRVIREAAVIGGGLAGLSAACALADSGFRVRLLEGRPYVGGRASSYEHPGTGEIVDNCQHVLLGCCTNLIDFYRQLGVADNIRWFDCITFLEPGGRRSVLQPGSLPAPLHNATSFMAAPALSLADKMAIGRGMMAFLLGTPHDGAENFLRWLQRHGQTRRAIERFWNPVLVSALNEDLDRVSVHYAAMVFRKSFMQSAQAGWMGVPSIPLSELYGHAQSYIQARGGEVLLRHRVEGLKYDASRARWHIESGDNTFEADTVVLAVPFEAVKSFLPGLAEIEAQEADRLRGRLEHFEHSPITGIHLWFDRRVTEMEYAVLLDATIQWMYNKSLLQPDHRGDGAGSYLELVVSASKSLVGMQRQEVIDLALRELANYFPAVRDARLLKAAVIKEVRATFSVVPGIDAHRPGPSTQWPGLFLAGDWTNTEWPSTMEGAVRSGYLAAEAITAAAGRPRKFLRPDLPSKGLMRLF